MLYKTLYDNNNSMGLYWDRYRNTPIAKNIATTVRKALFGQKRKKSR